MAAIRMKLVGKVSDPCACERVRRDLLVVDGVPQCFGSNLGEFVKNQHAVVGKLISLGRSQLPPLTPFSSWQGVSDRLDVGHIMGFRQRQIRPGPIAAQCDHSLFP